MIVENFKISLEAAIPGKVYKLAAPAGVNECVVWHEYAPRLLYGDDIVAAEIPRVQIDVIWQKDRQLLDAVKAFLAEQSLSYLSIEYGYDDTWAAMRCTLQLELI